MIQIEKRIAGVLAEHFKNTEVNIEKLTADLAKTVAQELAGLELSRDQGWQRYEAANRMCRNQQSEIASLNEKLITLQQVSK
jgi:hypothetical protein